MPSCSNSRWLSSRSNSARDEIAMVRTAWGSGLDMPALSPARVAASATPPASGFELLAEDAFLEVVLGIEQHGDRAIPRFADRHLDHVAHFMRVGRRAHRALVGIEHPEPHF